MVRKILLTGSLLIFMFCSLSAQTFQFVTFADYYGGIEPSEGYENLRSRVFMRPQFSGYDDTTGIEWNLSANLWVQPLGDSYAIDSWDILYETYLFRSFDYFDITLGQKTVTYGFADIYGPLNALHSTARDLYSLDDAYDSRQPDPLLQLSFYPTYEDTIEVTYVPVTRPDREQDEDVYLTESDDTIEWSDDAFILDSLHSLFLNYSHYGEKFDLQFFYGWYTENTPDFDITDPDSSSHSDIETVYHKKHTFGFAYSTRLGNGTFSQDFAFNLTSNFDGTDIGAQNSDITVNTQYLYNLPWNILSQYTLVYSYFINYDNYDVGSDSAAASYLAEQINNFHNQPYEHIAFIVGHFEKSFLREKLKTKLNVGFFFSWELYLAPRLSYSLSDYWIFETGADINLGDPSGDDLRRNPNNDNFYVRLLYQY